MSIVFKIFGYLAAVVFGLAVYMVVFLAALGLKPDISMAYAKYKLTHLKESAADISYDDLFTAEEREAIMPYYVKEEIASARLKIDVERDEMQSQIDSLAAERIKLENLKREIELLIEKKTRVEDKKMTELAQLYDKMDLKRVAEVLHQMDDSLIVEILPRMKSANASQVLEYMSPVKSAEISQLLLEGKIK
ncbi:MAG: hypothetical protein J7K40_05725 [candidate division Zixibacteria bacterium]|nr:hypothetical protein [candidate division Zixibacteria bacterium]